MVDIRIVVVGDDQCGKTSLISTLLSGALPSSVPDRIPDIVIPADLTGGARGGPRAVSSSVEDAEFSTTIVDTSKLKDGELEAEMGKASVIMVGYTDLGRVKDFWMPLISAQHSSKPVVLVKCKADTLDPSEDVSLNSLMLRYTQVETAVQSSAEKNANVMEAFYFAQKAVLFPVSPLLHGEQLGGRVGSALEQIFAIVDTRGASVLSNDDLQHFQKFCFGSELDAKELEAVKQSIRTVCPEGVTEEGVTFAGKQVVRLHIGFKQLHRLFIEKGRPETTWTVLRRFGFNQQLEWVYDKTDSVASQPCPELSSKAAKYIVALFARFDRDGDGALSWTELDALFDGTPGNPWLRFGFPECCTVNEQGWITLSSFLALWRLTCALQPELYAEYMRRLGFGYHCEGGLLFSRHCAKKKGNVLRVLVVGERKAGKSCMLRSFLGRPFSPLYVPTDERAAYAVSATDLHGTEKTIILMENEAVAFDAVLYVYDSSDPSTFASYIPAKRAELRSCSTTNDFAEVIIATKADIPPELSLPIRDLSTELTPAAYCQKERLPLLSFSAISEAGSCSWDQILDAAALKQEALLFGGLGMVGRALCDKKCRVGMLVVAAAVVAGVAMYFARSTRRQ